LKKRKVSDSSEQDIESTNSSDHHNYEIDDLQYEEGKISPCSITLGIICFPLTLLGSCTQVNVQEEVISLHYGKYTGSISEPGCHFVNCWGLDLIRVSKAKISVDLPNIKVVDKNGNPVNVSGIVVYHFVNIKRSNIDFKDSQNFVKNQSLATLKRIASRYPYEVDENDEKLCLSRNSTEITLKAKEILQRQVAIAGVSIDSIQFNQISYAPEIAQGMLKKQQAMAMIAARRTLVRGAVKIAYDAVDKLEERGIKMNPKSRTKLVSNLLTVTVSDDQVQPMLNLS